MPFLSLFGQHEVGMDSAQYATFMIVTSMAGIVLSTVLARLSDTRFSRRGILLLGSACGALGYVGYAVLRHPLFLAIDGCLLLGLSSITFSQIFAYARELVGKSGVPPESAPLYMNVYRLFFALAWTVGPATASAVQSAFSYTGTFLGAAVCFVLLFLAVLRYVPFAPAGGGGARPETSLRETLVALARPELLAAFAGFVLVFACGSLLTVSLPLFVTETLHGVTWDVGIIYSIAPFFELPLMFALGALASKPGAVRIGNRLVHRSALLITGGILLAVAYYGLLALVQAPWHIYPLQIISAAVTAVTQGIAISYFQDFLPDQPGTATNLYSNASSVGRLLGFVLVPALTTLVGYRGVFAWSALMCLVAVALMVVFREKGHRSGASEPPPPIS
jgi:SET family sugar efflux transporter-like MFS transporter